MWQPMLSDYWYVNHSCEIDRWFIGSSVTARRALRGRVSGQLGFGQLSRNRVSQVESAHSKSFAAPRLRFSMTYYLFENSSETIEFDLRYDLSGGAEACRCETTDVRWLHRIERLLREF